MKPLNPFAAAICGAIKVPLWTTPGPKRSDARSRLVLLSANRGYYTQHLVVFNEKKSNGSVFRLGMSLTSATSKVSVEENSDEGRFGFSAAQVIHRLSRQTVEKIGRQKCKSTTGDSNYFCSFSARCRSRTPISPSTKLKERPDPGQKDAPFLESMSG